MPESPSERTEMLAGVSTRLDDLENVGFIALWLAQVQCIVKK